MSGISWGGYGTNNRVIPIGSVEDEDNTDMKLNEDRYEVFVNGDFAGQKTLRNQSDSVTDVDDFLRKEGLTSFTTNLDGDHYQIEAENDEGAKIKAALEVYFQNR
ncbi:hypothetical protein [Fredinandcohnia quinoae]|uniref:Uncharacterized protein n=1 Tax=Fredinandcohnia quinoae TaxID=2918902 RepID=A0AAW5DZS7_9BACI|nr:hypothetical protein [Fredinandcohnia sp. SECRCQ15]MCH1626162.1 hypothetical protein [Fredinandcohnia sp. SECRCQ15]